MQITQKVAAKVLAVVDAGLVRGVGQPVPGEMCVEAAVCYALGLPHGDDPRCVSQALRALKIGLNDGSWSSKEARAKGLRRLAVAQLGSLGTLDDKEFVRRAVDLAVRKLVPIALHAAASVHKDPNHKVALIAAAAECEKHGTRESALKAKTIAQAAQAAYAYAAASAAYAAYAAAAQAAAAAADAAYAAAYVTADAAIATAYVTHAAVAAANAHAHAHVHAHAADVAAAAVAVASRDTVLSAFAEHVVQLLIEMKVPGCQWLSLTVAT